MSFKKLSIFAIGLFAIIIIAFLYFTLVGVLTKTHIQEQSKNTQIFPEATGSITEAPRQCMTNANEVKIYVYTLHYIIPDKYVNKENKIEYGNSISPEQLESMFKILSKSRTDEKIRIVSLSELEDFKKTWCFPNKHIVLLTFDDGWDDGYNFLFPLAKKYDMKCNLAIIADKVSRTPAEINNFLNEYEIQEMLDSKLMSLASHSFSHIELQKLSDPVLKKELFESKDMLQKLFHITVNSIVYPSGKYDDATLLKAKQSGYAFGFTTKKGIISKEDLDKNPRTLPRIRINRDTDIEETFVFE